jgi:glycosyltransferase involved in cell wall biosynthesis
MELHPEAVMRIAYILPHGWRFAGWSPSDVLERYHFSTHIASAMQRLGHEVSLILLHESVSTPTILQTEPFPIEVLPISFSFPLVRFGADVSFPLIRKIRNLDVDVLHIHGCFYESLPWFVKAAKAPVVVQWHGGRMVRLQRVSLRATYRKVRRIIIPFRAVRELFLGMVPSPETLALVALPLRPEAQTAVPRSHYGQGVPRLLYVGRIPRPGRDLWDRRLDILLRILGRLGATNFSLDVVGDGPGRSLCEKIATQEGIADVVRFHGYLSLDRLLPLYKNSDLTVVPFSLIDLTGTWVAQIQESLGVGTPVLAFSPDNQFSEHDLGWRISSEPTAAVIQLKTILSRPEAIERKGRNGPPLVHTLCDEQTVSRQLESVYRTVET